jgi:hypothetical protein
MIVENDSILPNMPEPARPVETDMTRIYVRVVIVEIITLLALYWMQRVFA